MNLDSQLVDELRCLFKKGATPSRLIRRVVAQHQGHPKLDALVRVYFREAFHVPMLCVDLDELDREPHSLPLAKLNRDLPNRMVQMRKEWETASDEDQPQPGWMESVSATDGGRLLHETDPTAIPVLAESWNQMNPKRKPPLHKSWQMPKAFMNESWCSSDLPRRYSNKCWIWNPSNRPLSRI